MRAAGQPDAFVVINGPEDGFEHTVVRAPFHIGRDETCTVLIRLDKAVAPHQALVTAVSEGYRIRNLGPNRVSVDGKPASMFRSRILRNNGVLTVGHTQLALDCAPDGLAHRSQGIVGESDFGWAVQEALRAIGRGLQQTAGIAVSLLKRVLSNKLGIFAILFAVYFFVSPVRYFVDGLVLSAFYYFQSLFQAL
jgi:hypothetical protein